MRPARCILGALAAVLAACAVRPSRAPEPRAPDRFRVGRETAQDLATGLVWQRVAPSRRWTWREAEAYCRGLALDGERTGWRVPSRDELKSIADETLPAPVVERRVFPQTPAAWFWTSTPFPGASRFMWGVSFEYGGYHYLYAERPYHVRCVRGAAAAPPETRSGAPPATRRAAGLGTNAVVAGRVLHPDFVQLRVRPEGWTLPPFSAGQTALLGLPAAVPRAREAAPEAEPVAAGALLRRRYTITSRPEDREQIEFAVRLRPTGALSPRLYGLAPGERVWLSAAYQGTPLAELFGRPHVVMIATGIGVAHYMSFLRSQVDCGGPRRIALIHGGSRAGDLFFRDELSRLAEGCRAFSYLPTLVEPERVEAWAGAVGTIEQLWSRRPFSTLWGFEPAPDSTHVSLCASLDLIERMLGILAGEGFRDKVADPRGSVEWCEAE